MTLNYPNLIQEIMLKNLRMLQKIFLELTMQNYIDSKNSSVHKTKENSC